MTRSICIVAMTVFGFFALHHNSFAIAENPNLEAVKTLTSGLAFVQLANRESESDLDVTFVEDPDRALSLLASMPPKVRESITELTFMAPLKDSSKYHLIGMFEQLKYLNVFEGKWAPSLSEVVAKLPLSELWAEATGINGEDLQRISECKSLRILMIGRNATKGKDVHCLKNLTQLTQLSICQARIETGDVRFLKEMPDLVFLDLAGTNIDDRIVPLLINCEKLKILSLVNSKLTDDGANEIIKLRKTVILSHGQEKVRFEELK